MTKTNKPHIRIPYVVPQKHKHLRHPSIPEIFVAAASIYVMILPVVFLDILLWQYQILFFGIMRIPKIKRSDYFKIDRFSLPKLTWKQRFNCWYCEYVNGVMAYAKAVANQTEIYSCAIKHQSTPKDHQHQKDFYGYQDFDK